MHPIDLSKFLSLVLRHDPGRIGLTLDARGWVNVDTLLAGLTAEGKFVTRAQLDSVVHANNKQRFRISDDGRRIRASQGHSIEVNLGLSPSEPPVRLYHGTAIRSLDSIRKRGILPDCRQYVHLSPDTETAVAVGARHGKPVVLTVRARDLHAAGHEFFLSENGVWLTDKVPPGFLEARE